MPGEDIAASLEDRTCSWREEKRMMLARGFSLYAFLSYRLCDFCELCPSVLCSLQSPSTLVLLSPDTSENLLQGLFPLLGDPKYVKYSQAKTCLLSLQRKVHIHPPTDEIIAGLKNEMVQMGKCIVSLFLFLFLGECLVLNGLALSFFEVWFSPQDA